MNNLTNEQKAIYAILADNVYWDVRKGYSQDNSLAPKDFTNSNWTPVPNGWSILTKPDGTPFEIYSSTQFTTENSALKGFTARAYQKEGSKEVVISFADFTKPNKNLTLANLLS